MENWTSMVFTINTHILMDKIFNVYTLKKEFAKVMGQNYYKKSSHAEIERAFRHFDKDDSGYITIAEFYEVMKNFRGSHSRSQLEAMVKQIDSDNNGKINIDGNINEFKLIFSNLYLKVITFLYHRIHQFIGIKLV